MGCGQSKIHLYPRKSKSKANGKKGGHADSDAETDEDEGHIEDTEKCQNRDREKGDATNEQSNKDSQETDEEVSVSLLRAKNLSLLQSQEISTSQQNFFRMLDKKIEEGPDYDSASETEIALEEARLNALVQHWESASLTASICSSASRSLQTTPIRQTPIKQMVTPRTIMQTTVAVPVPVSIPLQQQVLSADFLPHGVSQPGQLTATVGSVKHPPSQQVVISHMGSKMLHPLAMVPTSQVPLSMSPETSSTTANTSNAIAILQASNPNQQTFSHLLTLPTGSPQLLSNIKSNVSPKRLVDNRLLMNPNPLAQQMQNQFMATPTVSTFANGGRSPQPAMPMQMTYFGQTTAQQHLQLQQSSVQNDQQPSQGQIGSYYGEQMLNIQTPTEYRFPPAISVQRLAPQVQRQLRETQELIKDSCPQLYAAGYGGSPGPPIRNQTRNPTRRPTLETQFSQENS